jgi:hypothetical protein
MSVGAGASGLKTAAQWPLPDWTPSRRSRGEWPIPLWEQVQTTEISLRVEEQLG